MYAESDDRLYIFDMSYVNNGNGNLFVINENKITSLFCYFSLTVLFLCQNITIITFYTT